MFVPAAVIRTTIRSDSPGATRHRGTVAARLPADHRCRFAGDRRLVDGGNAFDDLAVRTDRFATETSTTSSRSSRDEGTDSMLPAAVRRLAIVSTDLLRRSPEPAASFGHGLGKAINRDGEPEERAATRLLNAGPSRMRGRRNAR